MVAVAVAMGGVFVYTARAAQSTSAESAAGGKWRARIKQQLNLSEDQLSQIKVQLKAEKENITGLLTRLHDARSGLRTEIQNASASETSVREASTKVSAVEADLAVERLKLFGKISPILTAEQRAKLAQMRAGMDQFVDQVINRIETKLSK